MLRPWVVYPFAGIAVHGTSIIKNPQRKKMKLSLVKSKAAQQITSDVVFEYDEKGDPKVGFKVVGPDSPQYRAEQERQRREGLKRRINSSKRAQKDKTDEGQAELDRLYQENMTRNAIAVVVDWFGFENDDGTAAAFDADQLPAIFAAKISWRDKVAEAVYQEDAFLPKPAVS